MKDESSNPNIEWKKTGFDKNEKLTLKTNLQQAVEYQATQKKNVQSAYSPLTPTSLPAGLKKIRKKIKEVYDDEDDEEESIIAAVPLLAEENSTLLNALNETEKKFLKQQETLNIVKSQENAARLAEIQVADKMTRELGLKGLKKETVAANTMDVSLGKDVVNDILKHDLGKQVHLKWRKITKKQTIQLLRGVQKIQASGEDVKGWNVNDVINVGEEKDDQEAARKILEKSGRKDKKNKNVPGRSSKKARTAQKEFNKMLGNTGR